MSIWTRNEQNITEKFEKIQYAPSARYLTFSMDIAQPMKYTVNYTFLWLIDVIGFWKPPTLHLEKSGCLMRCFLHFSLYLHCHCIQSFIAVLCVLLASLCMITPLHSSSLLSYLPLWFIFLLLPIFFILAKSDSPHLKSTHCIPKTSVRGGLWEVKNRPQA